MFGGRREAALSPSGKYPDSGQLFHRRPDGDRDFVPLMQACLDWEYGLVERLRRDGSPGFFVI
jgi:hypothetical protein